MSSTIKLIIVVVIVLVVLLIYIGIYNKLIFNITEDRYLRFIPEGEKSHVNKNGNIFTFVLESNHCLSNTSLQMLIIITSYVGHIELRSAHRRAYSQQYLDAIGVKRVFLLAKVPASEKEITQMYIDNEQERFGDLLQGNFRENYRNLPYKHLMGLEWAHSSCSNTKYILKADDDTVFNLQGVFSILHKRLNYVPNDNLLLGSILRGQKPIRINANKWFVSLLEYGKSHYPPYLSGSFYITTPSTARKIVQISLLHNMFWIDDVYVTGILANAAGINLTDGGPHFLLFEYDSFKCCMEDMIEKRILCDYLSGPNGGDSNLIVKFTDALNKCSDCRLRYHNESLGRTCIF